MFTLIILSLLCLTPAEAVSAAVADLAMIPSERHGQTRYLLVLGSSAEDRRETAHVVSFLLNSVSRTRAITLAEPTSTECHLVRIDLAAYSDFKISPILSRSLSELYFVFSIRPTRLPLRVPGRST